MGRGIAFKKKEGDFVDQTLIEKQFSLTKNEILPKCNGQQKLETLLGSF